MPLSARPWSSIAWRCSSCRRIAGELGVTKRGSKRRLHSATDIVTCASGVEGGESISPSKATAPLSSTGALGATRTGGGRFLAPCSKRRGGGGLADKALTLGTASSPTGICSGGTVCNPKHRTRRQATAASGASLDGVRRPSQLEPSSRPTSGHCEAASRTLARPPTRRSRSSSLHGAGAREGPA